MKEIVREDILTFDDCCVIPFEIPEWGCSAHLRTISGKERDTLQSEARRLMRTGQAAPLAARWAIYALSDSNGKRIFRDTDLEAVRSKNAAVLERIMEAAMRHNGIGEEAVEEMEKNSETTTSGDSGSS